MTKKPIIVLDEHPNWLEPLYEAFKKRGVEFRKVDISSAFYNPLEEDTSFDFYINRLSPSAGKRGHESAFYYTFNYIRYLESLGKRVVNGSETVLLEMNKALQSSLLRELNIPQPKTIIANSVEQVKKNLDSITFPMVVKPNCGGSGVGIQKFATKQTLEESIEKKVLQMPSDNVVLLQEFIQPAENHIVRVETINGKVVYAMKVFTTGAFNLCPSDACDIERGASQEVQEDIGYCVATPGTDVRFELYKDIPAEIVKTVEVIVKKANIECGGVEYLVDSKGDWFVYDINALSILRASFKEEYGIDGWGMLADFFIKEYEKLTLN